MAPVLTPNIDISEFMKNPKKFVDLAGNLPLAVLTNNKPSFYVMSPAMFEKFADMINDLQAAPILKLRISEKGRAVPMGIRDL
jgi:antitoxin StbD